MRFSLLLFSLLLFFVLPTWAQPANDDCPAAVALGAAPVCAGDALYANLGATASAAAAPTCFNAGAVDRDVWFSFETTQDLSDLSIFINGRPDGPHAQALRNPQVALYRGACGGLSELACARAEDGEVEVRLDVRNLPPNNTYYLRVNDFSATATPNAGDFSVCIRALVPDLNMGQAQRSTSCFGRLFDSGGPDGNYRPGERNTFTICPDQPHACIEIDLADFQLEGNDNTLLSDYLNIYAGDDTDAPLLASVFGVSDGTPFTVQAPGGCVTLEFVANFAVNLSGFELTWSCSALPCDASSADNATRIDALPFQANRLSTCEGKATVASSPCDSDLFLAGPDYVFAYESPGDQCVDITVSNARPGVGVVVYDGPPGRPGTQCVAIGPGGSIAAANMNTPGTYYIVVAKASGCTDFSIAVTEAEECGISPALADALRNPLNGCVREDGLPTVFLFQDGFQDMEIVRNVNSGCWLNVGEEADFYWFTLQAQTAGRLGFILESADIPSDIDFNVWGPFTQEQVLNDPEGIIDFIAENQPIRSTWSPTAGPTGMVVNNPFDGNRVTDTYDCPSDEPGATGDDFISVIDAGTGEVYVILVNDWGNQIRNGGVAVDWSPSTLGLLDAADPEIIRGDTAICRGESAPLLLDIGTNTIKWIAGTETLSCTDCPDPVATPQETTTYTAVVESVCFNDTIDVTVSIFDVDAGPDQTVCQGEEIQLVAGEAFDNAIYAWIAPTGLDFSCTDCPDPVITAAQPGTYEVSVTLTADGCTLSDAMILTVLSGTAPDYSIEQRNFSICQGESVEIGIDAAGPGNTYSWTSVPPGFTSSQQQFTVSPEVTTTYYVEISGSDCPVASRDSILVEVATVPVIDLRSDTLLCIGDTVRLAEGPKERNTTYAWTGPEELLDADSPQARAVPQNSGTYTLTATRGACTATGSVDIDVNIADVSLPEDTLFLCLGTADTLEAAIRNPAGQDLIPKWTSDDPRFPGDTTEAKTLRIEPVDSTFYFVELSYEECVQTDSVLVVVDSLPPLAIEPADTMICEGQFVVFRTPAYETSDYPDIAFSWLPFNGQQSPDSLLNMVVTPDTTTTYYRLTTNNACRDSTAARVEVKPIEEISILPADTILCFGEEVQYQVQVPSGKEIENVMWQPMEGLSCPGSAELDCLDPVATALNETQYSVNGEIDGCPVSAATTLRVYPTPRFDFPARTVICEGESVQLNNVATPGATYVWTSTDPEFGTVTDPTPVVQPVETTTYFLTATLDDPEVPCEEIMAELTIEVINNVELSVFAEPGEICGGEPALLSAEAVGGSASDQFIWNSSRGETFEGPEVTVTPQVTTTYFLTYLSGGGCQTLNRNVQVTVLPGVDVAIDTDSPAEVPEGSEVVLTATIFTDSPGPLDVIWTENGAAIPGAEGAEITVQPAEDGVVYTVLVTTPDGCTAEASITFDVTEPQFVVPNAFSPNGDGSNDRFRLLSSGAFDRITRFQVFNRWGQLVYDNENGPDGWDGTYNGNPQPSDVYAYIITVRTLGGNELTFQGEVTLIR